MGYAVKVCVSYCVIDTKHTTLYYYVDEKCTTVYYIDTSLARVQC